MPKVQYPNSWADKMMMSVFLQDSERRESELDELRHLLEKNHTAVTKWTSDAVERNTVSYFRVINKMLTFLIKKNDHLKKMTLLPVFSGKDTCVVMAAQTQQHSGR